MKRQRTSVVFILFAFMLLLGKLIYHPIPFSDKNDPQKPRRGRNLAFNICGQCHYDEKLRKFTGTEMEDLPGFMGKVYSVNLAHSSKHPALAGYTDEELVQLIKTGTRRDGSYLPYMIRPNLAEEDLKDIIFYFRSGDAPVVATDSAIGKTRVSILGKVAMKFSGKPLPYTSGITRPEMKDTVNTGRYLVDNLACYHCHSGSITSLNYVAPSLSKNYMEGGMKFKTAEGEKLHASNLTPDKETGIGNYSRYDFRKALKEGLAPGGRKLSYPMRKFPQLSNAQCDAIYYYLKTLLPVHHEIKGKEMRTAKN
jgi:hypothetical protein